MFYQRIAHYLLVLLLSAGIAYQAQAQNRDAVLAKLSESLGNRSLKEAPFLMFTCISGHPYTKGEHSFLYDWNEKLGRFEGQTSTGEEVIVLFDSEAMSGKVFINKKPTDDPELLKNIIQLFEDDSFLLFTPIRIANKELSASLQETEIINSRKYFVLKVSTPDAKFETNRLYIDTQNDKLSIWKTYDKKQNKMQELVVSRIKDAGGGLTLPTVFTDKVSGKIYQYPIVAALMNIEDSKFKNP